MMFFSQIRRVEIWADVRFRFEYLEYFRRRACIYFEKRVVEKRRLIVVSHLEGRLKHLQILAADLMRFAKENNVQALYIQPNKSEASLEEIFKGLGSFEIKMGSKTFYVLKLAQTDLNAEDAEPQIVQRIREAIVESFEKNPAAKGIAVHPIFGDVCVASQDVEGNFNPAVLFSLYPVFKEYIQSETHFMDIGSGDGRLVFLAATFGAQATGIENRKALIDLAESAKENLNEPRASFLCMDFFNHSFGSYDVLFYAGATAEPREKEFEEKLIREIKPGATLFVYREIFPFQKLKKIKQEGDLTLYRAP